jgi:hypothetical protein
MLIALFARNAGKRRRAAARARSERMRMPQAPPVNRLVENLKAVIPSPGAAPTPPSAAGASASRPAVAGASPTLALPADFDPIAMPIVDDVVALPPRAKRVGTLAMLRSSRGLLNAVVASEILAPPLAERAGRRGI